MEKGKVTLSIEEYNHLVEFKTLIDSGIKKGIAICNHNGESWYIDNNSTKTLRKEIKRLRKLLAVNLEMIPLTENKWYVYKEWPDAKKGKVMHIGVNEAVVYWKGEYKTIPLNCFICECEKPSFWSIFFNKI